MATTEDRVAVDGDSLDVAVQLVDLLLQGAVLLEQEEVAARAGLADITPCASATTFRTGNRECGAKPESFLPVAALTAPR